MLVWLKEAWPQAEIEDRRGLESDAMPESERKYFVEYGSRTDTARTYLRALIALGQKEVPESIRVFLSAPPAPAKETADYYRNLALLAHAEQRKSDALAYYQAALLARDKAPIHWRGVVRDPLLDEAKALFFANGGTEPAFALWSKPREPKQENAQGRWSKPKKSLPSFELSDLAGKTWKLKQLEGRSVLINLWATWCGPCRAELPHFQELYEKTRERTDVQVLTFNIDEDLGLVAPFMKENKFSFPVLFAHSFTFELLDGIGIPQNWLLDAKGNWIWTQLGFDASDPDWAGTMIKKLELAGEGK